MIITDQKVLEAQCAVWSMASFLAVDTEFLREKTYYAKLCLIQISAPDGTAAAIDTLAGLDLSPVMDLLHAPHIVKVFHAARQDLEIFYQFNGRLPVPVFDTQIAAMVCGYGEQVGYEGLVRAITGITVDKGVQFTDWSRRPLSDRQVDYAICDVVHLIDVYVHLFRALEVNGRTEWMAEEDAALVNPALYEADFMEAWRRIKVRNPKPDNLVVLQALAAWREGEAQRLNRPRGWIVRDEVLSELALRLPQSREELSAMRGVSPSFQEGEKAELVLSLLQKALAVPKKDWPAFASRMPMPEGGAERLELLKMLRKIHAARLGVAPRLLASSQDLEELARAGEAADIPLLHGWRYEASGAEMLALARGDLAIGLKNGIVEAFAVPKE